MVKSNQIKWMHLSIFVATLICGIVAFPNPAKDLDKGIFNVITGKGEISIDPDNKGKKRKVYGIIRSKNRKK